MTDHDTTPGADQFQPCDCQPPYSDCSHPPRGPLPTTPGAAEHHQPLGVFDVDGMPFVRCSCRDDRRPQSAVWLREHWEGDVESGVAALRAVVAVQKRQEATR